jgi:hypothetical protein
MKKFAFECYADADVFAFLRDHCRLALKGFHAGTQGEVVNSVLVKKTSHIGMVDEDPGKSHHRERDRALLVKQTLNLELRRGDEGHLIIVKPDLERCFQRSLSLAKMSSSLPTQPEDLHTLLSTPQGAKHKLFVEELAAMREKSQQLKVDTFATEIESLVTSLI